MPGNRRTSQHRRRAGRSRARRVLAGRDGRPARQRARPPASDRSVGRDAPGQAARQAAATAATPRWDAAGRTLYFGAVVVKAFRRRAPMAEILLQAFEEQGWPPRIDDPLPPLAGRRESVRLRREIYALNRRLTARLIKFGMDGTGQGIRWEAR